MKLNVGIIGGGNGWDRIMRQTGVPFAAADDIRDLGGFSCLIVSGFPNGKNIDPVKAYLMRGGSLLCSAGFYSLLSGSGVVKRYAKHLLGDASAPFFRSGIADLETEAAIPEGANSHMTDFGRYSIFTGRFLEGHVVALPFDAGNLYSDLRAVRRSFYSGEKRLPHELVSMVSKGEIFRMIMGILEHLHLARGFPFAHKWFFPKNFRSVFNWRIDSDGASATQIRELYRVLGEHNMPATWFVDARSQEPNFPHYREMNDQEFGCHGFRHKIFSGYAAWHSDIRRGKGLLLASGLGCDGYASPYGVYNMDLARAIEAEDFVYSSEFSYDYDSIPSFPPLSGGKTLQVPVHPVCIGTLRRQGYNEGAMIKYFRRVIDAKYHNHEPVFLYHHPGDGNLGVVRKIFGIVEDLQIPRMKLADYARWWKKREGVNYRLDLDGDSISILADAPADDVWIRVSFPDGTESFQPMKGIIRPGHLRKDEIFRSVEPAVDQRRTREFNYRIYLNRIEDLVSSFLKRR